MSGPDAVELARRFDLAGRVGGRHALEVLAAEVGSRAAAAFRLEHESARRKAAFLGELVTEVATVADRVGVPVVLLKFAALRASGRVADGLRGGSDVDVLVEADRATALAEALGERGLRDAGFPGEPHQLPQLRDAQGRAVEVHVHVPGLRLSPGAPAVTAEALASAGLLQRTELPGECSVPVPHVLLAHAVVHALGQHGLVPGAYPAFRLVADLVALGAHEDGGLLAREALPLVAGDVASDEMDAAVALARRLATADASLFEPGAAIGAPEERLLRHFVAGPLDRDYAGSLRLGGVFGRPEDGRRWAGLLHECRRALFLTDAQIDAIYGPPRSRLGYLGRRLARPFDLVRRAGRFAAAGLRLRLRRKDGGT